MHDDAPTVTVLLAMDEQHVVDFIRPSLAVCGFDTAVATNGQLALRLIETVEPDILLLDLMAPDADWPELWRRLLHHEAFQRPGDPRPHHRDPASHLPRLRQ
jgi:CheY-like chemotaxis protein